MKARGGTEQHAIQPKDVEAESGSLDRMGVQVKMVVVNVRDKSKGAAAWPHSLLWGVWVSCFFRVECWGLCDIIVVIGRAGGPS